MNDYHESLYQPVGTENNMRLLLLLLLLWLLVLLLLLLLQHVLLLLLLLTQLFGFLRGALQLLPAISSGFHAQHAT